MELASEILKYFVSMISIINPIGVIPVFLALTKSYSQDEISNISFNCALTVFFTLLIASAIGTDILEFFGIQIASFRVGGGILIGTMGLSMLRGEHAESKITRDEIDRQTQIKEIGIVPLAIPLLSGPGAITNAIIQAQGFTTVRQWIGCVIALLALATIVKIGLSSSRRIRERAGRVALNVTTRIAGLIILSLSIEHITLGIKTIFKL